MPPISPASTSRSPVAPPSAAGPGVITVVGEALIDLVVAADGTITAIPGGAPYNVRERAPGSARR